MYNLEEARSMVITKCIEVAGGGRMNREEAAEFTRKLVARAEINAFPKTPKTINNIPVFYFEAVLSALRGPQPDPDTGLMPCGCGGKARASTLSGRDDWFVECVKCHTTTYSNSKEGAEEKWDRAMGLLEVEE